uniref:Guanylate kinase-like domain-containing protein n=1 Tax=Angiostrongylus cantonensis TaxID=6313 RepID=A0A0K0DN75_ANGCA
LKEVIVSVERITEHLSKLDGKEEDSRILHDYFHLAPVQAAIEAIATHSREGDKVKLLFPHSVIASNGTIHEATKSSEPGVHVVSLFKREDTYLGATVRNEENRIVVGRVVKGGIIDKTGLLKEGEKAGKQLLIFSSAQVKLRAYYIFQDDIYVPCKELALKFQRGDILHVLSTEDENWWQAYREGDDNSHSLAGLIPSSSFHQQVVMYMDETERDPKPKCRAESKKRLQEVGAFKGLLPNSGDLDLLTYEEVVLHLSRTDRKRPLVLCGPEGVGCLELRQQLLESDRERLAGPVPYTTRPPRDGEIDGVHYHFVTKQRFLDLSKAGKFVEYGEYERYMYGTAAADILNVIRRSKTCVLTLKAESLLAVRTSEIMPFILFVAPPSLKTLRRQKECTGQFNVKDDELKGILTQGKRIEQVFQIIECREKFLGFSAHTHP